jgi:hypothetical protein
MPNEALLAQVLPGAISDCFGGRSNFSQLCHVALNSSHARTQLNEFPKANLQLGADIRRQRDVSKSYRRQDRRKNSGKSEIPNLWIT